MSVKTSYFFSRLLLYVLLMAMIVAGYALLASGLGLILYGTTLPAQPLVIGVAIFIITVLILPVRQRLQTLVDQLFLRGQKAYQAQVKQFQAE